MTILRPGINCMGVYEAGTTGLIIDARDYYRLFYHTARKAKRYILMTGWQFDTEVALLRGEDAVDAVEDVHFIRFLEALCEKNPELEIYILAWDFSVFFTLEREWFQDLIFNWSTNDRISFWFDNKHAFNATHHQKLVVVDGEIAFVGGMDICSARWDDRRHLVENSFRKDADGTAYGAYHDIQTYHTGPIVKEMVEIFQQRWADSGAGTLRLSTSDGAVFPVDQQAIYPLATSRVAVSRTQAKNLQPPLREILEIRQLFIDAIMSAEKLVYLENQYFSSQAIYWTLVDRLTAPDRSRLQIIMMLPDRLPYTEELFLGLPQMKMLKSLQKVADENGHQLRVYSSVCVKNEVERKMTFIHSKLLLVDDRFLTVGSANITNRSMKLDTELNVSWEARSDEEKELIDAIRKIRSSLLAEHVGLDHETGLNFDEIDGLVYNLDHLVDDPGTRLCLYAPALPQEITNWPEILLEPIARIVDPEEDLYEKISKSTATAFAKGVRILNQIITGI